MSRGSAWSFLFSLALVACAAAPPAPADAAVAARLQAALDSEALFTIAGGLKPVSCGFWTTWLDAESADPSPVASVRAELAELRDEVSWADVLVFHQAHGGRRAAQAFVADRGAVAATLRHHATFFAPHGLTPDMPPGDVFAAVERLPGDDRHRGLGLLFGYPLHAIEFFVRANGRTEDGKPLPRRFVQIPTYGAATGQFVYAVPPDHVDDATDVALRERAAAILARYRELRGDSATLDLDALRRIVRTLRAEFRVAQRRAA